MDSANVIQGLWSGTDNQEWNVVLNRDGTYRLENVKNGQVPDTAGGAEGDCTVQNTGGAVSQKWVIPQIWARRSNWLFYLATRRATAAGKY